MRPAAEHGGPVAAIVTAAGRSRRMGEGGKKEYRDVEGLPMLARAILPFLPSCRPVVVTVPLGEISRVRSLLSAHLDIGNLLFSEGGATRQESVFLALQGLEAAAPQAVLIHDGARPWVSRPLIERVIAGVRRHGACIPVLAVTEALKRLQAGGPPADGVIGDDSVGDGIIAEHLDRRPLVLAQTPQGFLYPPILDAHRQARRTDRTWYDDAEIYGAFIAPVYTVPGDPGNRKVTYPQDLEGACG